HVRPSAFVCSVVRLHDTEGRFGVCLSFTARLDTQRYCEIPKWRSYPGASFDQRTPDAVRSRKREQSGDVGRRPNILEQNSRAGSVFEGSELPLPGCPEGTGAESEGMAGTGPRPLCNFGALLFRL